ncbi:Required for respiratory growth protein 9 mitochondrial [Neofusicoccum ribis]|uniref:Required for respiratory growth protein 9, mitochondrial n=1 Tax=Neofusicoccum ribis TaxID=45134 RepID=A0ABR3SUB3_9PEZI
MSCPACSRRFLGVFIDSVGGLPTSLRPQHPRLPHVAASKARSRAFSTRPALRFTGSLRFPDASRIDGTDHGSQDDAAPSNLSPEPRVEQASADTGGAEAPAAPGAGADPDPAELRKELGLASEAEDDVQSRLWELTGGLSGAKPYPSKEEKMRKKRERRANETPGKTEKSEGVGKQIADLVAQGGVSRVRNKSHDAGKKAKKSSKDRTPWVVQKEALKEKFSGEHWNPRKKLSPDAMEGIRSLHRSDPRMYSTPVLANEFKISPDAVRRILKSKWQPSEEEQEDRMRRWEKRGEKIWKVQVEKGVKPPKKWRVKGVGSVKGGKDAVPAWKQRGRRRAQDEDNDFTRPRGRGANYGDEGGWSDRIL